MAYRFIERGTGTYQLASGTLGALLDLGDVRSGTDRGDGGIGTLEVGGGGGDATEANQLAIKALLDRMAPFCIGDVTGARLGTETFVYGDVTAVYTCDSDGNRTVAFP